MKKLLLIGGDSFIAQKFSQLYNPDSITSIARKKTGIKNEHIFDDFFQIPEDLFQNAEVCINFAAIVHQPKEKSLLVYDRINYELAMANAQKAMKSGITHFIQMSTMAVYGNQEIIDSSTHCMPKGLYALSKYKADQALLGMQTPDFKVCILRPPMVYGGGNAPGNMMRLIKLTDSGVPLPFKGIHNKKSFVHVGNLSFFIHQIVEQNLGGVQLVADPCPVSTEELIRMMADELNRNPVLFKLPGWILSLVNSMYPALYYKLFGNMEIHPTINHFGPFEVKDVENGIHEMVQWYKSQKSHAKNH
jgi:UDP-glucose 4-epimerase